MSAPKRFIRAPPGHWRTYETNLWLIGMFEGWLVMGGGRSHPDFKDFMGFWRLGVQKALLCGGHAMRWPCCLLPELVIEVS